MGVGLVLEGGGIRGAYTSGVLDVFMENQIEFPRIYGISAGACNALSFISGQKGRNREIFEKYLSDKRYVSVESLVKTGSLFNFDFIFGDLFQTLIPFDYKSFSESPVELFVGATDVNTGEAVFFSKQDMLKDNRMDVVRASSAQPFLCKIIEYEGREFLDGGVAQSIPIKKSLQDGNDKNVIVLTRDETYRKPEKPEYPRGAIHMKYGKYPNLVKAIYNRGTVYNNLTQMCREEEEKGSAVVIRPSSPITLSKFTKNPDRLKELYDMGVEDAKKKITQIKELFQ